MTPEQVVSHFTRGQKLDSRNKEIIATAKELNVNPQTVWNWLDKGHIPPFAQRMIQGFTGGKLKADAK